MDVLLHTPVGILLRIDAAKDNGIGWSFSRGSQARRNARGATASNQ